MKVTIKNAMLAFPSLDEAKPNKNGMLKFSGAFIFEPEGENTAAVVSAMQQVASDKWGEKAAQTYKSLKATDKLCLHDGDAKADYAGYGGNVYVNANANAIDRPTLVNWDRTPVAPGEGVFYAGCKVNVIVDIWAQDNQHGKRINAGLAAVQFAGHGTRLGGGVTVSADEFEALPIPEGVSNGGEGEVADLF